MRAVMLGHLFVNGPVTLITFAPFVSGLIILRVFYPRIGARLGVDTLHALLAVFLCVAVMLFGAALAWVYWSAAIPRWRDWVASHECDREEVQRRAVATLLVWPKGSPFERTELRRRDGRRGAD